MKLDELEKELKEACEKLFENDDYEFDDLEDNDDEESVEGEEPEEDEGSEDEEEPEESDDEEDIDDFEIEEPIEDSIFNEDQLMDISRETSYMLYQVNASLYVSDIIMEHQVLEGANQQVLMESFVSEFFSKLKETIKIILTKIKDFFKNLDKYLSTLFLSYENIIVQYKKELLTKDGQDFIYQTYPYDFSAGEKIIAKYTEKIYMNTGKYFDGLTRLDDLQDIDMHKQFIKRNNIGSVEEEKENILKRSWWKFLN